MRGSGNILGKVQLNDPVASSYTANFKGLNPKFSSKPMGLDLAQSCSTGVVVPDPVLLKSIRVRD